MRDLAVASAVVGGLGGLFGLIMLIYRFMATMLGEKFITKLDHEKIQDRCQQACIRHRMSQSVAHEKLLEQINELSRSIARLTDEVHNIAVSIDWIRNEKK